MIQFLEYRIDSMLDLYQADWRAVRGALVGCLALLRRKDVAGAVTDIDVLAMTKEMIQNVQAQSLALHDRKVWNSY